jgi:hypothetical protein
LILKLNQNKLKFIVVGTGRCGTVYMAKLLTEVGIPCSHERIFANNGINYAAYILNYGGGQNSLSARDANLDNCWPVIAESSYMAAPYLDHFCLKDATIIHVVRDPVNVILSFNNTLQYWHHIKDRFHVFI